MGLDTGSDQRADGEPESDGKKDVTDADHGGGSSNCARRLHGESAIAQNLAADRHTALSSCSAQSSSRAHRCAIFVGLTEDDPSAQRLLGVALNLLGVAD
jgi:hypothetical protein